VGFDFVRRLVTDPASLRILGDGKQSKSYIHVSDVVSAVLHANEHATTIFQSFNVATEDYITVTEIADLAVEVVGLKEKPNYLFTGGNRGWKGDVPIVRLNTDRIRSLGWSNAMNTREALRKSLESLFGDERILQ
jgi:UDP-glucose 4-epimerase